MKKALEKEPWFAPTTAYLAETNKAFASNTAGCLFVKDDGSVLCDRSKGGVCHSWISSYAGQKKFNLSKNTYEDFSGAIAVNLVRNDKSTDPNFKEFAEWVCREGPFAHCVLNADSDDIYTKGQILDTSIAGFGGVFWTAKALRIGTEETWKLKSWVQLRQVGFEPFLALLIAATTDSQGRPQYSRPHGGIFNYPTSFEDVVAAVTKAKEMASKGKIDSVDLGKFFTSGSDGQEYERNADGRYKYNASGTLLKVPASKLFNFRLEGKTVKKPDGWGGFVEKMETVSPAELLERYKEANVY